MSDTARRVWGYALAIMPGITLIVVAIATAPR